MSYRFSLVLVSNCRSNSPLILYSWASMAMLLCWLVVRSSSLLRWLALTDCTPSLQTLPGDTGQCWAVNNNICQGGYRIGPSYCNRSPSISFTIHIRYLTDKNIQMFRSTSILFHKNSLGMVLTEIQIQIEKRFLVEIFQC